MNQTNEPRFEDRVEDVLNVVHNRLYECRKKVDLAVADRPVEAVTVAFFGGWAAGRIGLTRVASSAIRLVVPLAPHLLIAVGTAALWECLRRPRPIPEPILPPDDSEAIPPHQVGF